MNGNQSESRSLSVLSEHKESLSLLLVCREHTSDRGAPLPAERAGLRCGEVETGRIALLTWSSFHSHLCRQQAVQCQLPISGVITILLTMNSFKFKKRLVWENTEVREHSPELSLEALSSECVLQG